MGRNYIRHKLVKGLETRYICMYKVKQHSSRDQLEPCYKYIFVSLYLMVLMRFRGRIQRGGAGGPDPHLKNYKNHKNIGFLSKTGTNPLKNYKAAKPAFNAGPSAKRHLNGVSLARR